MCDGSGAASWRVTRLCPAWRLWLVSVLCRHPAPQTHRTGDRRGGRHRPLRPPRRQAGKRT